MWAADIEGTVDVLPYDDPELSSFDSYRRKLIEYIDETKRQIGYVHESSLLDDERGKRLKFFEAKLEQCEKVVRKLDSWNPSALTPEMNKYIERPLFRMRWVDESIRIGNSERFRAAVLRGYSPEVFFSRYSESSDGFTFDRIDWEITLRTFRETRSQGKVFPLRTPDFDLVERGMILHKPLLPQDYAKLCDRYQIGEMTPSHRKTWSGALESTKVQQLGHLHRMRDVFPAHSRREAVLFRKVPLTRKAASLS